MRGTVYRRRWLNKQLLLGVYIGLSIITIFIPNQARAAEGVPPAVSISAVSQDCALQPVISRLDDCRYLARPSRPRSDAHGKGLPSHSVAPSRVHRYFISGPDGIPSYPGSFAVAFKRRLQQACRLLDLPPPASLS